MTSKLRFRFPGVSELKKASEAGFFCPAYVGLRAALVLIVLEGHYWFEIYPIPQITPLTFAVPCFFALSGFLISHTLFRYEAHSKLQVLKVFYMRRALRILPAFFLVLFTAHAIRSVPYVWWQASYLINVKIFTLSAYHPLAFRAYLTNHGDFQAIHFWSVAVEEQFYILYPLFLLWTAKRFRTGLLGLAILGSIGARLYLMKHHPNSFYGGLGFVAGEYILWGCLFAWLDYTKVWTWLQSRWALYGSILAFGVMATFDRSYGVVAQWRPPIHQTVYAVIIATFVVSLRYGQKTYFGKLLSWRALIPIGKVSYGAYLLHIFLNPVADRLAEALPFLVVFPSCPRATTGPLVTLAVALLMWYLYEEPINRLKRRWTLGESE